LTSPAHAEVGAVNELQDAGGEDRVAADEPDDVVRRRPRPFVCDLQHLHRDGGQRRQLFQLLEDQLDALLPVLVLRLLGHVR
jgi:hypothetical protein